MNPKAASHEQEVMIQTDGTALPGFLVIPHDARALVLFAHGSGSSRFSSRNRFVADVLHEASIATLLFDLLTEAEHRVDEYTRELRFDIPLLARRLTGAIDWSLAQPATRAMQIGLFGASTGAAAALLAAAARPESVQAVVSRGGRPDLAGAALAQVRAPVLLIVGSRDQPVIGMNQEAAEQLQAEHRLSLVEGATHLFEEPGTLDEAARLAQVWFRQHLPGETGAAARD
ncbi:MAG: alpha/beta family hydrolase [Phycisphaeraceae bacterium]